jgi:hypothetical protein
MYAVTGITGKVGGIVARTLLAAGVFRRRRRVSHDAARLRPRARLSVHARSNRGGQDRHRRTAWEGSLPIHGRCPGGGIQSNTKLGTIAVRGGRTRLMWASARGAT